jgi:hypothetical protein
MRRGRGAGRARRLCFPLLALALAALAGCGPAAPELASPAEAAFPVHVAGFDRVGAPERSRLGRIAGYQLVVDADTLVVATVHVRPAGASRSLLPSLDRGQAAPEEVAAAVLERSIDQVRHFYPALRMGTVREAFLVRNGQLRSGRQVTLQYDDLLAGQMQPIDLDITVLCCSGGGEVFEYRFRHAASVAPAIVIAAFMEALPWTSADAAAAPPAMVQSGGAPPP